MKSISVAIAVATATLLPLAASAQVDLLHIACLPQAQQDDIRAKANVIYESATSQRNALGHAIGPGTRIAEARRTRAEWEGELKACLDKAKAAGRSAVACEREEYHLKVASRQLDDLVNNTASSVAIDAEQDRLLRELRAQYPACPASSPLQR